MSESRGPHAYTGLAALLYERAYGRLSEAVGRQCLDFYLRRNLPQDGLVVDVCCGTGQVAQVFKREGIRAVGIDLSFDMLSVARRTSTTTAGHLMQANVTRIPMKDSSADLVICSTDSLNHLPSWEAVDQCVASVRRILRPGGWFIVDVLTRSGFSERSDVSVTVQDTLALVAREIYDEAAGRAWTRITAFTAASKTTYRRVDMNVCRILIDPVRLSRQMHSSGFRSVVFSTYAALGESIKLSEVESAGERICLVAQR